MISKRFVLGGEDSVVRLIGIGVKANSNGSLFRVAVENVPNVVIVIFTRTTFSAQILSLFISVSFHRVCTLTCELILVVNLEARV